MGCSETFEYEEHEGRKYLVYEKGEEDTLDIFTVEMLSNNSIEGTVPFSCIRLDQSVHMRYNITGLKTLRELFTDTISRQKFLDVLETLADALIRAEDYMLNLSAYILDESFIYVDPARLQVYLIVLPIQREGEKMRSFLKQLIFDARYDQTEDCSYVASLMNFLGNESEISIHSFKQQVMQFKKKNINLHGSGGKTPGSVALAAAKKPEFSNWKNRAGLSPHGNFQDKNRTECGGHSAKHEDSAAKDYASNTPEKQENLHILFSDYSDEEPKKKKKGLFSKKEKSEKQEKEKRGFFRKREEKKESGLFSDSSVKSPLDGLAIPGMDILGKLAADYESNEDRNDKSVVQRRELHIPAQHVNVSRQEVVQQDFGETVYMDEEAEAPTVFEEAEQSPRQRFVLYRYSTQETFEIKGDVVRVGRSSSVSEICISGNRGVGRVHAVLYVQGSQVYIADNNSKNRTYVDGVALKPGDSPTMLLSGSKIKLGTEELEFRKSR